MSYLNCARSSGIIDDSYVSYASVSSPNISNVSESPGTSNVPDTTDSSSDFHYYLKTQYPTCGYPSMSYSPIIVGDYSQQYDLISDYLVAKGFVLNSDFYMTSCYSSSDMSYVFNFIINEPHCGRPVIANTPEHSFVVYGYVPNTHQLICHYGWQTSDANCYIFDCDSVSSAGSPGIQYAISADFYEHSHSYEYLNASDNEAYCFCGDTATLYPYVHKCICTLVRIKITMYSKCTICNKMEAII